MSLFSFPTKKMLELGILIIHSKLLVILLTELVKTFQTSKIKTEIEP